jgi:hypothetical protein
MSGLQRFLRRRRFLTCPSLQMRLLLATFGQLLIVSGALAAGLFGPSIMGLLSSDAASDRALAAASEILYLHLRFWPALALALLFVALDSIRISHKIAGPLYRFDKALERVRQGRVPEPIRLRKGDFLHEDCRRINTVLELTRSHLVEVREVRQALTRSIEEARNAKPGLSSEELEGRLGDLVDRAERLVDLSRRFDLDERNPES